MTPLDLVNKYLTEFSGRWPWINFWTWMEQYPCDEMTTQCYALRIWLCNDIERLIYEGMQT